jgi:DNA (cytosine-5)-methyltransferase 1
MQDRGDANLARKVAVAILKSLIEERNRSDVRLTRPTGRTIECVIGILQAHLDREYAKNSPRLPHLAIYALQECLSRSISRYSGLSLQPIGRMKEADRKSGAAGDVEYRMGENPVEAIEVKHRMPITKAHIDEVIEKIRSLPLKRYYVLSTAGVKEAEEKRIDKLRNEHFRSHGCEIIVNGVLETIAYGLRQIPSTDDFIQAYVALLERDPDIHYEHKIAWNEVCEDLLKPEAD